MTDETSVATSPPERATPAQFLRSMAGAWVFMELLAATARGFDLLLPESAATGPIIRAASDSSTDLRELSPELKARLDAMLDSAREAMIEDGMFNPIAHGLPALASDDFSAIVPALLSAIEGQRVPAIVGAEILKELGGLRNLPASSLQRWLLERALHSSRPFTRDGAGLGLARLADPRAIDAVRRAIEREPDAQTRANLQIVLDELAESVENGSAQESH